MHVLHTAPSLVAQAAVTPLGWFAFWAIAFTQGWLVGLGVRQSWQDYRMRRTLREIERNNARLRSALDWPA